MKHDYLPRQDSELYAWETNFNNTVSGIATTLGIDPLDVNAVKALAAKHQGSFDDNVNAQKAALSATATLKAARIDAEAGLRKFANRLKAAPLYTETMGKALGIIGEDSTFDHANAKPKLKLSLQGGNIVIDFNNPREVNGVQIFSKRGTETAFTFLAVDTESPYVDNRVNLTAGSAEERNYYAFFFENDSIIGLQSDVVSVSILK